MTLDTKQRSELRKLLIKAGHPHTRKLDNDALIAKANELKIPIPQPTNTDTDLGEGDVPPDSGPKRERNKPRDGKGEGEDVPTASDSDDQDKSDAEQGWAQGEGEGDPGGDPTGQDSGEGEGDAGEGDSGDTGYTDDDVDSGDSGEGADDDGSDSEGADDESREDRDKRQDEQRQGRSESDDPITDLIRKIANEEIDGRELADQLAVISKRQIIQRDKANKLAKRLNKLAKHGGKGKAGDVDYDKIISLIKKYAVRTYQVEVQREHKTPEIIKGVHPIFPSVLIELRAKNHVYLVGPAGSGKSHLAETLATALDVPFFFTPQINQKYELMGFVDANGNFQETSLYKAVKQPSVFLFDEADSSNPQAFTAFNQMLANGKVVFPNGEQIDVHPEAKFIAAANTIGHGANRLYVGRNALDGASLDRFFQIEMGYDESMETRIAHQQFLSVGGDENELGKVDAWIEKVRSVRKHVDDNKWSVIISPRASIMGARSIAGGQQTSIMLEGLLYKHLSDDQRRQLGVQA